MSFQGWEWGWGWGVVLWQKPHKMAFYATCPAAPLSLLATEEEAYDVGGGMDWQARVLVRLERRV